MPRIRVFDTTLRDGEQTPGASLTVDEKVTVAKQLARLKVDVIEAGFPAASPGETEAVRRISTEVGASRGGPAIAAEGRRHGGCPTGEARITTGGNLKARYVIHTVGPVYRDGGQGEPELLASCYRESLKLASANGIRSLAFPSISTGVYGYPIEDAARIALKTMTDYLAHHPEIERVRMVLFGRAAYEVYAQALQEL